MDGIERYLGSGMIRGVGPVYAKKLVGAFGEKVFDTIEAEPERLRAGISFALTEAMDGGNCGLPKDELIPLAGKLLEVPPELIRTALDLELSEGTVIADHVGETPCIFLAGLYQAERGISDQLMRLV